MTLVSVITPTWQRHDLLMSRCVDSVYAQTWPRIEHIVVSDGPDRQLADILAKDLWRRPRATRALVYDQLPEHLEGPVDYGSRARNRGLELATGDYIAYLDDDNAWRPDHLDILIEAIGDNDFAYSRMMRHPNNDQVGDKPPVYGSIDTSLILHRRGLPQEKGMWPLPHELGLDKHAPDWGVVERWLNNGATWVHVPVVTIDYYFPG